VVFAVESHTDMIAHAMGIDPYALRLRNVLQDGQVCAHRSQLKGLPK
jgi:CO/xanthine dehydrogenase Mo-binding subunit